MCDDLTPIDAQIRRLQRQIVMWQARGVPAECYADKLHQLALLRRDCLEIGWLALSLDLSTPGEA